MDQCVPSLFAACLAGTLPITLAYPSKPFPVDFGLIHGLTNFGILFLWRPQALPFRQTYRSVSCHSGGVHIEGLERILAAARVSHANARERQ